MSEDELATIEARANAASPEPWAMAVDDDGCLCVRIGQSPGYTDVLYMGDLEVTLPTDHANADFIAAARADVPALVAEVRRLRAGLTDMRPLTNPIGHDAACMLSSDGCSCGADMFNDRGGDVREMLDALLEGNTP